MSRPTALSKINISMKADEIQNINIYATCLWSPLLTDYIHLPIKEFLYVNRELHKVKNNISYPNFEIIKL